MNPKDDDDSSSSPSAFFSTLTSKKSPTEEIKENRYFIKKTEEAPKKRMIINVSDSLSYRENNDISFQKKADNMSKPCQNITSTKFEKQYSEYKKKGINDKSSLLNTN